MQNATWETLMQVGAKDGRIKIVGREGVEATLTSDTRSSTRYMQFLTGRGVLLRITEVRVCLAVSEFARAWSMCHVQDHFVHLIHATPLPPACNICIKCMLQDRVCTSHLLTSSA